MTRWTPEQEQQHRDRMARFTTVIGGAAGGSGDRHAPGGPTVTIYPPEQGVPYAQSKAAAREPAMAFVEGFAKARGVVEAGMAGKPLQAVSRSFRLRLPWPPTVNHSTLPAIGGGRILTSEHKAFRAAVALAVYEAKVTKLYGRLKVYIRAHDPDNRMRDLDNIIKSTLDAIQRAGAIENDRNVDDLHIVRSKFIPPGTIDVEVEEI